MLTSPDSIRSEDMAVAYEAIGAYTYDGAAAAIARYRETITRQICDECEADLAECFDGGVSELVFWSFRYFLGRRSIHATVFARELAKAWPHLERRARVGIAIELDVAFRVDEGVAGCGYLGDHREREAWQLVRDAYTQPNETAQAR